MRHPIGSDDGDSCRLREGRRDREAFHATVRQFQRDEAGGFWRWLPPDAAVVEQAVNASITLPDTVFLRTADCLHLVTAALHGLAEIHTPDLHQIKAPRSLALEVFQID
jgi:hypothetical protein